MWLTNGGSTTLVAVLVKTDEAGRRVYKNMTTFLLEKPPASAGSAHGLTIPGKIEKMGYKGVDTTELIMEGLESVPTRSSAGEPGRGFYQMMDGVEVGRVNVAARAAGWPTGPSSSASPTPSSGRPSARRSPSTRRCCSGWPRWRPRSRPPTR